jgi:dolichyl-phosphate-mannose-protein mannosyltransferase
VTRSAGRIAALAGVAVALYLPLIGWGLPYATAPDRTKTFATDEILPMEALAEMHNTFVTSKADRNYGYPWWHYFVVAAAQSPYLAYARATGDLSSPSPSYPFGFRDPVRALQVLTIAGRLVSVLMAAGIVAASFFFARALWDDSSTALVAAALTMLNYLMFYYSRTGNLDVPAFFWSAAALAVLAIIVRNGLTTRAAVWFGVLCGLAAATKDQSVALFVPLGLVVLLPRFDKSGTATYRVGPAILLAAAAALAYAAATGMLIDPRRHLTHVYSMFFDQTRVTNWAAYYPTLPRTWTSAGLLFAGYLRGLADALSPPVLAAAVCGFVLAVRDAPWRLWFVTPFVSFFVLLVWLPGGVYLRYLLPLTLFADAFAAFAVMSLRRSRSAFLFVPAVTIMIGWRLLMGADLTYAQVRETRSAAAEWFRIHARPGDTVEYFGVKDTMPPMSAAMRSRRIMGRERWTGEFGLGPAMLEYLKARGPEFVVIVPDWTSPPGLERSADCPPEVFAALVAGTANYDLVAYFPTPSALPFGFSRPALDNPSVSPPVRVFARADVASARALVAHDGTAERTQ